MEKLYAPWRGVYVQGGIGGRCVFCVGKKTDSSKDKKRLVVERGLHCFSILNRYPYNSGHIMVAPYRHVKSLEFLKDSELLDLFRLVNYTKKKIDRLLKPAGYNMGLNIGRLSGAGFPGHVHMHIVPRWEGDTNFMPVVADIKVVSHSLSE
ncbi:MAG: HIT domain-containing protein, partial [Candidatus Omnitrophota bacterium]